MSFESEMFNLTSNHFKIIFKMSLTRNKKFSYILYQPVLQFQGMGQKKSA